MIKVNVLVLILLSLVINSSGQEIKKLRIEELEDYINKSEKPIVVNFWATFCDPCVQELPHFQSIIGGTYSGQVELLLVSLDLPTYYPDKIASFVSRKKIKAPVVWLNESNADIFCPRIDKSWSGTIPATLFVNNKTRYRKFYEEQFTAAQLRKELKELVK